MFVMMGWGYSASPAALSAIFDDKAACDLAGQAMKAEALKELRTSRVIWVCSPQSFYPK